MELQFWRFVGRVLNRIDPKRRCLATRKFVVKQIYKSILKEV